MTTQLIISKHESQKARPAHDRIIGLMIPFKGRTGDWEDATSGNRATTRQQLPTAPGSSGLVSPSLFLQSSDMKALAVDNICELAELFWLAPCGDQKASYRYHPLCRVP
ncbi:hypothetical protein V6Z77_000191 [Aspergillus fumigatus]